jgi:hypothetical protein
MTCRPANLHPGDFVSLSGCDYELISIDQTDDFYSLYIEHLNTRRRALIVIHSSTPITRTN